MRSSNTSYTPMSEEMLSKQSPKKSKKFNAYHGKLTYWSFKAVEPLLEGATLKSRVGWEVEARGRTGTLYASFFVQETWVLADGSEILMEY